MRRGTLVIATAIGTLTPALAFAQEPTTPAPDPAPAPPTPTPTPPPRRHRDDVEFGVAPMLLANVHWLDPPGDRRVSVGNVSGVDGVYPGFVGADLAWGVMVDGRFFHIVGLEVDVLRQSDRGSGTVTFDNQGIPCIIRQNGGPVAATTQGYTMTIGQGAWHLPILAKLSIPGRDRDHRDDDDREMVVRSATFALGPEAVFPDRAELSVTPDGLCYPRSATASPYIMYTAALGGEWRLLRAFDLRFMGSLRASYNPGPGDAVSGRGQYFVQGAQVQPSSYRSEWRYQIAATLGLGLFF